MPHATARADAARAVIFSPLEGAGRAELVEQRLTDAIVSGVLHDGERLPSEADLAKRLGVALVTAREALVALRHKGLVRTRRGRDGGSFVTYDRDTSARLLDERLRATSRIELRDLSLHVAAIAGMAAEVAADRASDDDVQSLVEIDARADLSTPGGARRAVSRFQLEVAAVSQSPRLVHEELRLQAESGSFLWLCLRRQEYRDRSRESRLEVIDAIRAADAPSARRATVGHITSCVEWLIDEKARLESESEPPGGTPPTKEGSAS
ncbi:MULTISPECIES: FadR/GntR family transcriptional regulator [unclassified Agromyces]|uniref:FadR/GntR family transcriptional regulator n=1 Tax=unclassified Agromyces TaxID=2639701 RepID=UPI0030153645